MPVNCTVKNVTMNSVEVGCFEGYSGGLSQHFVLEIREENIEKKYRNFTAKKPEFSVEGLSNSRTFQVFVYAVNAKGKSQEWKKYVRTLSPLGEKKGWSGLWNAQIRPIIVTGVAGIVFMVLLIVFVVKVQAKRNSGKPFAEDDNIDENHTQKAGEETYSPLATVEDERGPDILPGLAGVRPDMLHNNIKSDTGLAGVRPDMLHNNIKTDTGLAGVIPDRLSNNVKSDTGLAS
ncbi:uncharacterized protein LOC111083582, partial [Limulus polyphemus]|uniref:Uncharacterized protein LOC111083582 n=1 Tax=Limulus polyphemus TaxID=6850 RepID=A0ABM1RX02_LIMPO